MLLIKRRLKKHFHRRNRVKWLGIPRDKKIALYVGRIDSAKGADTFAASSESVSEDTLCVLIGSGPLVADLQAKYAKALFLAETAYRDLPRVLAAADVLVLPNSAHDENAATVYIAAQSVCVSCFGETDRCVGCTSAEVNFK